jgi:prophage maintenance system killer protein
MQELTNNENQVLIYKTEDGQFKVEVKLHDETVWLTQKQMATLFDKNVRTISEHIRNIFKEGELDENSVVRNFRITAEDGKAYDTQHYNLDVIISVGYRVSSMRGTNFRIWATKTLREHLIKGYTLNQNRLKETGLAALESALKLAQNAISKRSLTDQETHGLLEVITSYAKSWLLLKQYDEQDFTAVKGHKFIFTLTHDYACQAINELKANLMAKGEAAEIFGRERENGFKAILGNLEQTFGGQDLYPTIEEKAAHLLYFIIKDHPFLDGNKRTASFLFILYLEKNSRLRNSDGEIIINDNALVALALLIAESEPKNKELMIQLVINLIGSEK